MVAVTYDVARVSAGKTPSEPAVGATAEPYRPWYARFVDALIEARMQQAEREIARHIYLIPHPRGAHGSPLVDFDRRDVPFGGW